MTLAATCHCGNVRVTVPGPPEFLNECLCTVCYKLGGVWAYYKTDQVTIDVKGQPSVPASDPVAKSAEPLPGLSAYLRTDIKRTDLAFCRCAHCGCLTHWTCFAGPKNADHLNIGVNSRLMDQKELEGVERRQSPGPL